MPPLVIGLGELLWDLFPDGRRAGGAPANVAYHANQLGARGLPASCIGTDPLGDELLDFLQSRSLETRLIQRDPDRPTGTVTVELTAGGQPRYIIHEQVAWDHLQPTAALLAAARDAAAICFGTLAQRTVDSRETIHRCLAAAGPKTLIVYDVNLRQHWYDRSWIERSLRTSRIVKLNDEELPVLARLLALPDESLATFAAHTRELGVQIVVLTRGAAGCSVATERGVVDVSSAPIQVVDTVGAGDAFTAAFIHGLLLHWPPERAARLANAVGGLVASRAGAMPEIAEQVRTLVATVR
jgi:fructokinase